MVHETGRWYPTLPHVRHGARAPPSAPPSANLGFAYDACGGCDWGLLLLLRTANSSGRDRAKLSTRCAVIASVLQVVRRLITRGCCFQVAFPWGATSHLLISPTATVF